MRRTDLPLEEFDVERRFWAKVDKGDSCWTWTGATVRGYGQFTLRWWRRPDGAWRCQTVRAHRLGYLLQAGELDDALTLDHLCKTRNCVRASHLEPVSAGVNSLRGDGPAARAARATHCSQGHLLGGDNAVRRSARPNSRECRTCANDRRRVSA